MFEKIGRYAETVAASAVQTRRGFLGGLGQAALVAAGLMGGLLLFPREVRAYPPSGGYCCDGTVIRKPCACTGCPCAPGIKHKGQTCPRCISDCG
jgi:hypothetical protein